VANWATLWSQSLSLLKTQSLPLFGHFFSRIVVSLDCRQILIWIATNYLTLELFVTKVWVNRCLVVSGNQSLTLLSRCLVFNQSVFRWDNTSSVTTHLQPKRSINWWLQWPDIRHNNVVGHRLSWAEDKSKTISSYHSLMVWSVMAITSITRHDKTYHLWAVSQSVIESNKTLFNALSLKTVWIVFEILESFCRQWRHRPMRRESTHWMHWMAHKVCDQ